MGGRDMAIQDRVVLITGATGPLGRAAAAAFGAAGARLGLGGTDEGRLREVAEGAGLPRDRWTAAVGDLRRPEDAQRAVAIVRERLGPVDVLLHLVGGWSGGTAVVDLDPAELAGLVDQHLWTAFHATRAVVPGMLGRGWGRVIAVSSPVVAAPIAKGAAYTVAKAAEEALLLTLAREVASRGVTVNVLAVRAIDASHERETQPTTSNASWTTPEEIAAAMLFLCSDDAASVNGARIPLHGRA